MGIKGTVPLAAHQVALNCASLVFMVPLSIGSAGSVRSGRALGAGDPEGVRRAGWTAIASGVAFAAFSSAVLALGRGPMGHLNWCSTLRVLIYIDITYGSNPYLARCRHCSI